MPDDPKNALGEFVRFAQTLRGDEKSEAQSFLDHFFRAFGLDQPGENPLRDAHARLDAAVRAAYGMPNDADPLAFLLALNLDLAAKEKAGEPIVPPGVPKDYPDAKELVTKDSIKPS